MASEMARFNADISRMLEAKTKIGLIIASIAMNPEKYLSSTGNYEIRNVYEVCEAFNICPKFFRKVFKNRYGKDGKKAFVEFTNREIETARKALECSKKAVSESLSDSEAGIFSIVVHSIIGSSTKLSFYGLE